MGWERKRGKLEELNRLLRGDTGTSYSTHIGDPGGLSGVRFVITLDSDTQLPMGSAQRLVGLLAHPLEPRRLRRRRRVASSPATPSFSLASRPLLRARVVRSSHGSSPGTSASTSIPMRARSSTRISFGAGIYVGKGIYDVDAFMRSVEGRAPDNALVSHDLFEGIHGRTALATRHRPLRELPLALRRRTPCGCTGGCAATGSCSPWLFPRVPSSGGAAAIEHAVASRSLEDRRQSPPKPDEPPPSGAPRARVDLSTGKPAPVDAWGARARRRTVLSELPGQPPGGLRPSGTVRAGDRVSRARVVGRVRRHRARSRPEDDHAKAPAPVDERRERGVHGVGSRLRPRPSSGG